MTDMDRKHCDADELALLRRVTEASPSFLHVLQGPDFVFGYLAMTSEPVLALDAPASDTVLNASALEMVSTAMEVVALVGVQPFRSAPWPTWQAPNSRQVVDELFEKY